MNNLKFRTYHKKEQKMYLVSMINFDAEEIVISQNNKPFCDTLQMNEVEIMQPTGLKDKNGKEIFVGDILRLYNEEDDYELFVEVIFNSKSCFWGKKIKNNTDDLWNSDILYNYNLDITEIVWNIHENPELINS